jgi:hypothetical protein
VPAIQGLAVEQALEFGHFSPSLGWTALQLTSEPVLPRVLRDENQHVLSTDPKLLEFDPYERRL